MSGAASLNLCGQLKWAALVFPTKTPDLARGKQELPSQAWLQLHWCSIPLWQDTSAALTTLSKPQVHWGHLYSTAEQTKLNIFHTLAELRPTDRDGNTNQSQQEPHNDNTELSSPQKLFNSSRHLKKRFFLTWPFHPPLFHSQKKKSFTENLLKSSFQIHLVAASSPLENAVQQLFCSCAASAREL